MRIVQVTPRFPPAIGGMENHVYFISNKLAKKGHDIAVVTSNDTDERMVAVTNSTAVEKVEVYRFPILFKKFMREYWPLLGVTSALDSLQPDLVHAHGYRCLSSCAAAYWCRKSRVPLILTPHGIYPSRSPINGFIKSVFDHSFGNHLLRSSERIVALTENNRQLLRKIGAPEEKIALIPNGVDINRYKTPRCKKTAEKRRSEGKILLYVGRVDWNKGLERVVESMPFLTQRFGQVKFLIVGPDYAGYSRNLLALASRLKVLDSIVVTGKVAEEQLLSYYSMADCFVFPSLYEGLSLSLLEAMASQVPVVASKTGGTGDLLVDGENALVLQKGSSQEMSSLIEALLENNELRNRICLNAFKLVSEQYSWDTVADRLEELYIEAFNMKKA